MNESFARLAALAASGRKSPAVVGDSAIASALNESAQTVYNWKKRGVSKEGAIKAAKAFGGTADYILEGGELPPDSTEKAGAAPEGIAKALQAIRNQLAHLGGQSSEAAGDALRLLALTPDSDRAFSAALAALGGATISLGGTPPALIDQRMARELALGIDDDVRQAIVLDFLARLEREPERERAQRNHGQSATASAGKIHIE